jgi:hypothetical protein
MLKGEGEGEGAVAVAVAVWQKMPLVSMSPLMLIRLGEWGLNG